MKILRKKTFIQLAGAIFPALIYVINENYKKVDFIHLLASLVILLLLLFAVPIFFRRIGSELMRIFVLGASLIATVFCLLWFLFLFTFHTYETDKGLVVIGENLTIRADTALSQNEFPTTFSMMDPPSSYEPQLIYSDINIFKAYFLISYYFFILFAGITIFSACEHEFGEIRPKNTPLKFPPIKFLPKLFFRIKRQEKPKEDG